MTPTHRLSNPGPLHRSNHRESAHGARAARYDSHSATTDASEGANANPQASFPHALRQNTLTYHEPLADTGSSSSQASSQLGFAPRRNGCIRHDRAGADNANAQDYRHQQHARGRAVPINLAFRLANRSNGVPLATIVEQGSYSTLNPQASLLGVGPFASLRVMENTSPRCGLPKILPASDEHALRLIIPNIQQERVPDPTTRACSKPADKDIGNMSPHGQSAVPSLHTISDHLQTIQYQIEEIECDGNSQAIKDSGCGVLHHVRVVPRTQPKSSSTRTPVVEHDKNRSEMSNDNSNSQLFVSDRLPAENHMLAALPGVSIAPLGMTQLSDRRYPSRDAGSLPTDFVPLAHPDCSSHKDPLHSLSSYTQLSKPLTAKHKCQLLSPVRLVVPEPRAELQAGCGDNASKILPPEKNPSLEASTFYGVSVSISDTHSPIEADRASDASQNTSFCSTISTSYSGAVVGVDVDLQHEFPHTTCRSRVPTPVAPVWFTPQMAALERHTSGSRPPKAEQVLGTGLSRRSITSSALTTLLPIAAASGIVHPNYNTPKISFLSPSGSLIQPEGSPTPSTTNASDFSGPTVASTSKSSKPAHVSYSIFPATCLPPPRPSLRPMTTPPTSSVPLPANLRHHHNYRRPEKSQINPEVEYAHSFNEPGLVVKGCDGIVPTSTLPAYTQSRRSYEETKARPQYTKHRSARVFRDNVRLKVRSRKAMLMTAICTTTGKGRILRKQDEAATYASMPHKRRLVAAATSGKKRIHDRYARRKCKTGLVGPIAGHVLRVCFCQPYDGAGKQTHDVAAKTFCMRNYASDMHGTSKKDTPPTNATDGDVVDAVLPNARVVTGVNRKINTNRTRKRMSVRREQASLPTKRHAPSCQTAM
jgi:hypothetical protein